MASPASKAETCSISAPRAWRANDIVTGAVGVKYKPSASTEIGVAWEVPLTERRDVLENRITVDWIVRY